MRVGLVVLALLPALASAYVSAPSVARAQASDSTFAVPLAESLFREGRALAAAGNHDGACAKFEASLKLDARAVGTLLNLAMCKEAGGKLASAWALYRDVATKSRGTRQDRYDVATANEAALSPRLSFLVLQPPSAPPPGFAISVDGVALAEAAWSTPLPVDGGEHVVEASARGRDPFRTRVTVARERDRQTVVIPPLTVVPEPLPPGELDRGDGRASSRTTIGLVVVGTGLVAMLVGGALGVHVLSRSSEPQDACPDPCVRGTAGAAESERRYDSLDREQLASTILVGAGAAITAVGLTLILTAPKATKQSGVHIRRTLLARGSWLGVAGAF